MCKKIITDSKRFHRFNNNKESSDVCMKCSEIPTNKNFIEQNKLELIENNLDYDIYEFGSLLDWVPLIYDECGNMILFNYNKDSKYVGRLALVSTDNFGRMGFFITNKNTELKKLLEFLNTYQNDQTWNKMENLDKFYNFPIKKIMQTFHMPVFLG